MSMEKQFRYSQWFVSTMVVFVMEYTMQSYRCIGYLIILIDLVLSAIAFYWLSCIAEIRWIPSNKSNLPAKNMTRSSTFTLFGGNSRVFMPLLGHAVCNMCVFLGPINMYAQLNQANAYTHAGCRHIRSIPCTIPSIFSLRLVHELPRTTNNKQQTTCIRQKSLLCSF